MFENRVVFNGNNINDICGLCLEAEESFQLHQKGRPRPAHFHKRTPAPGSEVIITIYVDFALKIYIVYITEN